MLPGLNFAAYTELIITHWGNDDLISVELNYRELSYGELNSAELSYAKLIHTEGNCAK